MSNKATPFRCPSPLKAETPIDGRIVFEVGADRFAIDYAITELNQKPAQVIPILRAGPWQRSPATPAHSDAHDFVKIQDDQISAEGVLRIGERSGRDGLAVLLSRPEGVAHQVRAEVIASEFASVADCMRSDDHSHFTVIYASWCPTMCGSAR